MGRRIIIIIFIIIMITVIIIIIIINLFRQQAGAKMPEVQGWRRVRLEVQRHHLFEAACH